MTETINDMVARYRQGAMMTGDVSDPKKANKGAKQLHACYKTLQQSEEGRNALIGLMADPEPSVRRWAAAKCLQWDTNTARRVLEALRDSQGPFSFDAEMTLKKYDNGRLTFE